MVVRRSSPCSSLFSRSCPVFTYQLRAQQVPEVIAEVPALGLGRVRLRAPEDVDEERVEVPLVAVGHVAPQRELLGGVGLREAVAEVEADVETRPEGALERLHHRDVRQLDVGVADRHRRLLQRVGLQRAREALAVEGLDQELAVALDRGDLVPLDLEVGVRVVGLERQHVLFDALDLAHQPVAARRHDDVLGRVCDAAAACEHYQPETEPCQSVNHECLLLRATPAHYGSPDAPRQLRDGLHDPSAPAEPLHTRIEGTMGSTRPLAPPRPANLSRTNDRHSWRQLGILSSVIACGYRKCSTSIRSLPACSLCEVQEGLAVRREVQVDDVIVEPGEDPLSSMPKLRNLRV